jgi:hypothetical protein
MGQERRVRPVACVFSPLLSLHPEFLLAQQGPNRWSRKHSLASAAGDHTHSFVVSSLLISASNFLKKKKKKIGQQLSLVQILCFG